VDITVDKLKELWQDPHSRKYVIAGGILAFSLMLFTFLIIPEFVELARVSRQARDIKNKINITEDRINRIDQMRKRVTDLRKELGEHSKQLPAEKEITELLEGFAAIAKKSDVRITGITPLPLKKATMGKTVGKFYQEMPIKISAKSGYHQLGHFISSLERERRVIIIDDIEIRSSDATPRIHNITMLLKTYVSIDHEKKS